MQDAGALTLAKMDPGRMTPRSKHYAIKYHCFRSQLKPNKIEIENIASANQRADILTKGLVHTKFLAITVGNSFVSCEVTTTRSRGSVKRLVDEV
jgi:hypothetical protein